MTKRVRDFVEACPLWILKLEHIVCVQMELNANGPDVMAQGEPESTLLPMADF